MSGWGLRRSGALVNDALETIFFALFHPARTLSGSLRSPPSPRGEGFAVGILFLHVSCIRFDDARKAASSYRSLPHWGRGTASAVDRVLSQTAYLRRSFPLVFHAARTLSGSLRSPPSPRGEGFVCRYSFSTYACIRFDDERKAVLSYRCLPHWGKGTA